jgi:hypothetical protein
MEHVGSRIYPVTPQLAAYMQEHRDAVDREMDTLAEQRARDRQGDYLTHVHTYLGPITLHWDRRNPKATAVLRMGPMATIPSEKAGMPHLSQGTLIVGRDMTGDIPETLWEAIPGRRLGDVLTHPNPFMERLSDLRINGTLRMVSMIHLHLDVPLVDWEAGHEYVPA